eukprot:TRINITY_DN20592_c0_g1_i2.p1 TRINITY_DN20592_c0_g1~~TRINITY_DN20592_c0_g1_i2.p1  ORF type:complete len:456 (-),score=103.67 TRINITY_DN20592_c0_g1_i2:101-1468(-)
MIRRPPRSTLSSSSAASDVYKRQTLYPVVQFVLFTIWGTSCTLGTVTFLEAVAPVSQQRFTVLVSIAGSVGCPLFWAARDAISGRSKFNSGNYLYSVVICVAILVPAVLWFVCGGSRQAWRTSEGLASGGGTEGGDKLDERVSPVLAPPGEERGGVTARLTDPHPMLVGSWERQRALAVLVVAFWGLAYCSLAAFLHILDSGSGKESAAWETFGWFILFVIVCQAFKTIGKRLGVMADQGKRGTFSLYFALEFLTTLLYYTFYRTLFDRVVYVWMFAVLQGLHICFEWLVFPFKASATFWAWYTRIQAGLEPDSILKEIMHAVVMAPGVRTHRDLECVVTMEVALRMICSLFSAVGFLVVVLLTHKGPDYLQSQFKEMDKNSDSLGTFVGFTASAMVTEILNVLIMELFFFRPRKLSVLLTASDKLFGQRRYPLNIAGVSATLLINIVYPKIDYQ